MNDYIARFRVNFRVNDFEKQELKNISEKCRN